MLIGVGDGDMDIDTDFEVDADSGMHIFSVRSVIAFFTGFGWTGAIALKAGQPMWASVLLAIGVGGALMFVIVLIMRLFWSMRQDGTIDYRNAVGEIGTVYLPIPPGGKIPGKIEITVQGRLTIVEAFQNGETRLENRSQVKVTDTIGERGLLVEPLT
jgi:hypothetical protein